MDILGTEFNLEGAYSSQGSRRGPNFCWKVRQGTQIITHNGSSFRKTATGKLHPVTRISSKPNDNFIYLLRGFAHEVCSLIMVLDFVYKNEYYSV